jgi:hypothetical protein
MPEPQESFHKKRLQQIPMEIPILFIIYTKTVAGLNQLIELNSTYSLLIIESATAIGKEGAEL